jgi:Holliday junction resolvase RusA-like endonuclease
MTQRDKWLNPPRECVQRYRRFKNAVRAGVGNVNAVPDSVALDFYIPMPDSWSEKKKIATDGKPHRQKPDKDNLEKAVLDALFKDDSGIWTGHQSKWWCRRGKERIEITMVWEEKQ